MFSSVSEPRSVFAVKLCSAPVQLHPLSAIGNFSRVDQAFADEKIMKVKDHKRLKDEQLKGKRFLI